MIVMPAMPLRNPNVGMVYNGVHFSSEECDQIVASAKEEAWQPGGVGGYGEGRNAVVPKARSCTEQRLPFNPQSGFPLDRICHEVCNVNANGWRFDLTGFVSDDMPYLMRYTESNRDHYEWHMDMGRAYSASRKLSFSLQLSASDEYDGGDLEFYNMQVDRARVRQKGTLVIFPTYWLHKVHPVTRGTRHVVVGWLHGPSYR